MKGLRFARKSITQVWRPIDWLLGFNRRRRRRRSITDTSFQPVACTGLNLNVMSFNIRRGTARDGRNHWVFRRNRVQEILHHYRPDVLGLQEAMDFQISAIRTMLPGYEMVGVGNMGGSEGLHNAIFYDATRFILSEEGTFWLSDTPDIPGSKGWGNILRRTCTWARLIEKESRQAFYFYNTHLDHISLRSRKKSVVLLTQRIQARSYPDPFVLTGDFNAREKSAPDTIPEREDPFGHQNNGESAESQPAHGHLPGAPSESIVNAGTFHGFRRFFFRLKIDYIFVPPSVRVQDAQIITMRCKECFPSDHFPLITSIAIPERLCPSTTG